VGKRGGGRVNSITLLYVFVSSWAGGPRIMKSGLGRGGMVMA